MQGGKRQSQSSPKGSPKNKKAREVVSSLGFFGGAKRGAGEGTSSSFGIPSSSPAPRAVARPVRKTEVSIPAAACPPNCRCWEATCSPVPMWSDPSDWPAHILAGVSSTAAISGAKLAMCAKPQSEIGPKEHRVLHISLNNGEIHIDVPLLEDSEDAPGVAPLFTRHWFCTEHRMFEFKETSREKPATPVEWFSCIED